LFATKSDDELSASTGPCYALVCKHALYSIEVTSIALPPAVANLLQEYMDIFLSEVVNRTLSTMLQAILKDNLRLWEECLPHIEFAYNRSIHSTTKLSPFMVVYGFNPRAPIDLLPLPPSKIVNLDVTQCSEFILKLHETTKLQIEKMNEKYRIAASKGRKEVKLEPDDLMWVHLRKDRFPDL
jgi:hypothetical protein